MSSINDGTSRNAKNPGIYGNSRTTSRKAEYTHFIEGYSSTTRAATARLDWSLKKLISTPPK